MLPPQPSPTQPITQRRTPSSIRQSYRQFLNENMSTSIHPQYNTVQRRTMFFVLFLAVLLMMIVSAVYYSIFYTPKYIPRVPGDIYFDPPVCIQHVNNLTTTYNNDNHILSMYDLQHGIHNIEPAKLTNAQDTHEPLEYYISGNENSVERQRFDNRQYKFHILWEDPVRKCPCHTCMHKLSVLVRSFLATQNLDKCSLTIWASEPAELYDSVVLAPVLPWVVIEKYNPFELAKGTFLENNPILNTADERVYLQGDLFRWLVLYVHGGIYVDADTILLNDFQPLLDKGDFWARWACTDYMSPGIMSLQKRGKVQYELLQRITKTDPSAGGYIWGRGTMTPWYNEKVAKQKAGTLTPDEAQLPFMCPACYFYPQWCTEQFHGYFDAPVDARSNPPELFLGGFAYHWHGGGGKRFERSYEKNSQFDLTERYVSKLLQIKYGTKSHDVLDIMKDSIEKAKTTTGIVRHRTNIPSWDTEHWYTTAFNQYDAPNTCSAATVIAVEHVIIYTIIAVAVFCLITHFFVKGGIKQAYRTTRNTTSQIYRITYYTFIRLLDYIGNILYTVIQLILQRLNRHRYQALPTQSRNQSRFNIMQRLTDPSYKQSTQRILVGVLTVTITIVVYLIIYSLKSHDCGFGAGGEYTIGMYIGTSVLSVNQASAQQYMVQNPVLTKLMINDRPAKFVADPFIIHPSGNIGDKPWWYVFFEVQSEPTSTEEGDIGVAASSDGVTWRYRGIVLDESYHLSYPYVFQYQYVWYMIPETGERNQIRLYQSISFPSTWTLSSVLLDGAPYLDTSIFQYRGHWYLFTTISGTNSLYLYVSDNLHSGWTEHPKSPVVYHDASQSRPAGRVAVVDNEYDTGNQRVYRFAQNNVNEYGHSVNAYEITQLSPTTYTEQSAEPRPLLQGSKYTDTEMQWNSNNMHHIDTHLLPDGKFIAAVDGCGF